MIRVPLYVPPELAVSEPLASVPETTNETACGWHFCAFAGVGPFACTGAATASTKTANQTILRISYLPVSKPRSLSAIYHLSLPGGDSDFCAQSVNTVYGRDPPFEGCRSAYDNRQQKAQGVRTNRVPQL